MAKLDKNIFKIWKIAGFTKKDNIFEIVFKTFDYFSFVDLIVNYRTLSFIQSLDVINFKYPGS